MSRVLARPEYDRKIAGVCSGVARYFNLDATLVRIIFVILALSPVNAIPIYLILWLIMPSD